MQQAQSAEKKGSHLAPVRAGLTVRLEGILAPTRCEPPAALVLRSEESWDCSAADGLGATRENQRRFQPTAASPSSATAAHT